LNLLTKAGDDGLHVDDILYLLGFNSKAELFTRLNTLKVKKQIKSIAGDCWKFCPEAKENNMETSAVEHTETYIAPASREDLPTVYLPGQPKFSSYKNTLQEYCQKKKYSVPQYKALKESNGLVGTVTFALNFVRSSEVSGSVKEADARAAFESLQHLGYMQDATFEVHNHVKRKEANSDGDPSKVAKLSNGNEASFKSRLNELAQKKQIPFPTYDSVNVNGGFFSTVTFNDNKYKSMTTCKKRKEAEQSAAQVALNVLVGTPLPEEAMVLGELDVTKMVSEARKASQPVALKNRLQEYCQRLGKTLPQYETKANKADKTYQSTVTVQDQTYTGSAMPGKKNAETSAAEAALKALELMA